MAKTFRDLAQLLSDKLTPEQRDELIAELRDDNHPINHQRQNLQQDSQQLMDSPQVMEQVQRQDPRRSFHAYQAQITVVEEVMDARKQALKHTQANEHAQATQCYARAVATIEQGPIGIVGDREYRLLFLDAAKHIRQHPDTVNATHETAQRNASNLIANTLGADNRTYGAACEASAAVTQAIAQTQGDIKRIEWAREYLVQASVAFNQTSPDQPDLARDDNRIRTLLETNHELHQQQQQGYDGIDH